MSRVLVVYGSETGGTKENVLSIVSDWKATTNFNVTCLTGNEAAGKFDTITTDNYDFLVVATSSYGDGDAPANYGKFLYCLQNAASTSSGALSGLQHAVLGRGSTAYDTYMNCSRLTDRALGRCGSRRCVQRGESDEMADDEGQGAQSKWLESVTAAIKEGKGTATDDEVCDWDQPEDTVFEKDLGPDGEQRDVAQANASGNGKIPALIAAAVAFSYYWFVVRASEEESE